MRDLLKQLDRAFVENYDHRQIKLFGSKDVADIALAEIKMTPKMKAEGAQTFRMDKPLSVGYVCKHFDEQKIVAAVMLTYMRHYGMVNTSVYPERNEITLSYDEPELLFTARDETQFLRMKKVMQLVAAKLGFAVNGKVENPAEIEKQLGNVITLQDRAKAEALQRQAETGVITDALKIEDIGLSFDFAEELQIAIAKRLKKFGIELSGEQVTELTGKLAPYIETAQKAQQFVEDLEFSDQIEHVEQNGTATLDPETVASGIWKAHWRELFPSETQVTKFRQDKLAETYGSQVIELIKTGYPLPLFEGILDEVSTKLGFETRNRPGITSGKVARRIIGEHVAREITAGITRDDAVVNAETVLNDKPEVVESPWATPKPSLYNEDRPSFDRDALREEIIAAVQEALEPKSTGKKSPRSAA